jgi:hypothetical protein
VTGERDRVQDTLVSSDFRLCYPASSFRSLSAREWRAIYRMIRRIHVHTRPSKIEGESLSGCTDKDGSDISSRMTRSGTTTAVALSPMHLIVVSFYRNRCFRYRNKISSRAIYPGGRREDPRRTRGQICNSIPPLPPPPSPREPTSPDHACPRVIQSHSGFPHSSSPDVRKNISISKLLE